MGSIWEMTEICVKWLKYIENDRYVENGLSMWEMAEICRNRFKYVTNDLDMWEIA